MAGGKKINRKGKKDVIDIVCALEVVEPVFAQINSNWYVFVISYSNRFHAVTREFEQFVQWMRNKLQGVSKRLTGSPLPQITAGT